MKKQSKKIKIYSIKKEEILNDVITQGKDTV